MKKGTPRWLWLALGLLFVVALAWNFRGLSWEEEEVDVGASGPARRNPWYGVELLLDGRGVPAESAEGLTALPPTDHVILWMARQPSQEPLGRLEAWVRSGGHLVTVLPTGTQRKAFKALFGDDMPEEEDEEQEDEAQDDEAQTDEAQTDEAQSDDDDQSELDTGVVVPPLAAGTADLVPIEDTLLGLLEVNVLVVGSDVPNEVDLLPPQGPPALHVQGLPWLRIAHFGGRQLWPAVDDTQAAAVYPAVRVALGQGWVTLLASTRAFDNHRLGEADHAALIWALVQRDGPPPGALLIVSDEPASIWALLASYAGAALLSGGVLLVLWLWRTLPGFGPLLPDPSPHRRSLVEHVVATGALLWRVGQGEALVASARRALAREVDDRDVLDAAPRWTGGTEDEAGFTYTIQALYAIWRARHPPKTEGPA